jgi:plasmid stabilization system protein ParE
MRLRYSAAARRHLEAIYDFIAERNPSAAQRVIAEIQASARLLIEFPHMGRAGVFAGRANGLSADRPISSFMRSMRRSLKFGCLASSTVHKNA